MTKWDEDLTFKVNLSMTEKDKMLYLERDLELGREALRTLNLIKSKFYGIELNHIDKAIENTQEFIIDVKNHIKEIIGSKYIERGFHDEENKPF